MRILDRETNSIGCKVFFVFHNPSDYFINDLLSYDQSFELFEIADNIIMITNSHQLCFLFELVIDNSRLQEIVIRYGINDNPYSKQFTEYF